MMALTGAEYRVEGGKVSMGAGGPGSSPNACGANVRHRFLVAFRLEGAWGVGSGDARPLAGGPYRVWRE